MTSTWYDDFFTELPNAFWRAAVPPEATDAEIDFLVRTTGLRPGDSVPCAPRPEEGAGGEYA